jgi:hypothetical protein
MDIEEAMKQAERDANYSGEPMCIVGGWRTPWVISLEAFANKYNGEGQPQKKLRWVEFPRQWQYRPRR